MDEHQKFVFDRRNVHFSQDTVEPTPTVICSVCRYRYVPRLRIRDIHVCTLCNKVLCCACVYRKTRLHQNVGNCKGECEEISTGEICKHCNNYYPYSATIIPYCKNCLSTLVIENEYCGHITNTACLDEGEKKNID